MSPMLIPGKPIRPPDRHKVMPKKREVSPKEQISYYYDYAFAQFELRLAHLKLSKEDIDNCSLEQLKTALDLINDAIGKAGDFGIIRLRLTTNGHIVVAKNSESSDYEIGITPILLERKRLIIERLISLSTELKSEVLKQVIQTIPDERKREKFEEQMRELGVESASLSKEIIEAELAMEKEQAAQKERAIRLDMEVSSNQARIVRSFLEKESVASVVGSILLFLITLTLVVAMFLNIQTTDVISNAFLIILGYFFGQTVSKATNQGG